MLGAGSEIRRQETPLASGKRVEGVAGATRFGWKLELSVLDHFLPPQQLKFYSAQFSLYGRVFTGLTNTALICSAHKLCNSIKQLKKCNLTRAVKFRDFDL